jgi:transcriptional regulator with XRE-family HTH domain
MQLSFGQKLLVLRKKKKVSQTELATQIGISQSNIANYESDKIRPSYEVLIKLADFFETSTDFLLRKNTPKSK